MSAELRRQVLELYAEVDREVRAAGPVCVASGRCCRFKEYGHTLFLSNLEADGFASTRRRLTSGRSRRTFAHFKRTISARRGSRVPSAAASTIAIPITRKPATPSRRNTCAGSRSWPRNMASNGVMRRCTHFLNEANRRA